MSLLWFIGVLFMITIVQLNQVSQGYLTPGRFNKTQYYWLTILSNTPQYIRLAGFQPENHTVTTPDGYRIQIHRIVNRPRQTTRNGYPIVLFTAFDVNSEIYMINADGFFRENTGQYYEYENDFQNELRVECPSGLVPMSSGRNLAYTLANCGYDVWLANLRDSRAYSSHLVLDPNRDPIYWNVNLDKYSIDAKAIIEYVLQTKQTQTTGVLCHSVSCPVIYQLIAESAHFNHLIKPFINLGPFVYSKHLLSFPLMFNSIAEPIFRNYLESEPDFRPVQPFLSNQARINIYTRLVALLAFSAIGGLNLKEIAVDRNYRFWAHFPGTAAIRVFAHMGQRQLTNDLYKYDYGVKQNMIEYGSPVPPQYNMSNVVNPYIVVFTGTHDLVATRQDIDRLRRSISVPFYKHIHTDLSHLDMVFGRHVNITINLPILKILHQLGFQQ